MYVSCSITKFHQAFLYSINSIFGLSFVNLCLSYNQVRDTSQAFLCNTLVFVFSTSPKVCTLKFELFCINFNLEQAIHSWTQIIKRAISIIKYCQPVRKLILKCSSVLHQTFIFHLFNILFCHIIKHFCIRTFFILFLYDTD